MMMKDSLFLLLTTLLCGVLVKAQTTTFTTTTSGTFNILRDPESCKAVRFLSVSNQDPALAAVIADPTCVVLDWAHINQMRAYTTYQGDNFDGEDVISRKVEARIGPLYALNSDERLDYECPPDGYNGFDYQYSYCELANNSTLMAVAHVSGEENVNSTGPLTGTIMHGLDLILAGKPFPDQLEENAPPFGAARYTLAGSIPMLSSGSLIICDDVGEVSCEGVQEEQTLDLQGLNFAGSGIFSALGADYTGPSVWIHDDDRQLLHLTAGAANGFWFNDSGYFLTDYQSGTCQWFDNCNFACEVYNYDSRFLDFIGIWNITDHVGIEEGEFGGPQEVRVYLGNAIDAAGVFPCLMYISMEGYYLGLDKLDTTVGTGGSSFWYSEIVGGTPDFSAYPIPDNMGCPGTTNEWLGGAAISDLGLTSDSDESSSADHSRLSFWASFALVLGVLAPML